MNDWIEKLKQYNWKSTDRLAPIALTVLIICLCWKVASMLWLLVAPPQVMQMDRVELGSQQPQVPNISSFALFQEVGRASSADENLNMMLQGVVVGYPNQFSSAVIKVNETAERYRVGETVEGSSYTLSEVYWDKVFLRSANGAVRELAFKGIENGLNQPIVPTGAPSAPSMNSSVQPSDSSGNQTQNALGQAVQRMQENRDQYMQEMGVSSSSGGGFEVTARTPAALRNKLGLQPGDKIVSMNGQSVGAGLTEVQLLEQARREGQVKLEIKRGDQVMTVQQDFK
ncbi:type II secretion system protein N [Acinetobacter sp. ANC 3813]|uniref:type II secretion system protein N n=1 Tax=Acinetobacter sp. ANC 3813 TaxID=1977873 RepID=UPI000A33C96E|nr:type II secretion system protein N [Acinetobacter sp. ANC 3813]OTG86823.1 general secretion pathway protein [Acinetobacter sp. ANC 3813]